jgi:hypothetical protein
MFRWRIGPGGQAPGQFGIGQTGQFIGHPGIGLGIYGRQECRIGRHDHRFFQGGRAAEGYEALYLSLLGYCWQAGIGCTKTGTRTFGRCPDAGAKTAAGRITAKAGIGPQAPYSFSLESWFPPFVAVFKARLKDQSRNRIMPAEMKNTGQV